MTPVYLMLECKGEPDEVSEAKHSYVEDWWIPAVANSPETPAGLRRWTFRELTDLAQPELELDDAIQDARRLVASPSPGSTLTLAATECDAAGASLRHSGEGRNPLSRGSIRVDTPTARQLPAAR